MSNDHLFTKALSTIQNSSLYTDQVVPRKFKSRDSSFRNLFKAIFSHHVLVDRFRRDISLIEFTNDPDKVIQNDEVSAIFRELYLDSFKITETANQATTDIEDYLLDSWRDVSRILSPAVKFPHKNGDYGSNNLSILIGNAGEGKSLLLTKILSDKLSYQSHSNRERMIPIYISMESAWPKNANGVFNDIDDKFWELILNRLVDQLNNNQNGKDFKYEISEIINKHITIECKIRDLCRLLPKYNLYSVIIIDNLDRFYFSPVRYSFFEEYTRAQLRSIQQNINSIFHKFSDPETLGYISASVVLACRRETYNYLMMLADGTNPNEDRQKRYRVYQLLEPSLDVVILSRLKTLKHIINDKRLQSIYSQEEQNNLKAGCEVLDLVIKRAKSKQPSMDGLTYDIMGMIVDISHQGWRGLIQFLSEIDFDVRKNAEALERVFSKQPRNLLRLYISNRFKRYSQCANHFPNIFLNDCTLDPNPDYILACKPHRQTYWLKWIILKLIEKESQSKIKFSKLYRFLKTAGYEDHVIRLAVGSLATPNSADCIEIRHESNSIDTRELSLTKRGAVLVSDRQSKLLTGIPLCFTFDYLQLVADDLQMSYPAQWADLIVPSEVSHDYALKENQEYHNRAIQYLSQKMPSTLYFLQLLESSWIRETRLISKIGEEKLNQLNPNFKLIRNTLLSAYSNILENWDSEGWKDKLMPQLNKLSNDLMCDETFQMFWDTVDNCSHD